MSKLNTTLPSCPPGKEYGSTKEECVMAHQIVTCDPQGLLTYIRRHGFPCRVEYPDGKLVIRAACPITVYIPGRESEATHKWQIDTIEPTLAAVRTWVGY